MGLVFGWVCNDLKGPNTIDSITKGVDWRVSMVFYDLYIMQKP